MKTIEELFNEVKKDEKLKEEGIAAIQAGKLGDFMKAHGCDAFHGESAVNQASITGESMPVDKDVDDDVD